MIAVLFEVEPVAGREDYYLAIAAGMRPALTAIPGFVSVERFRSLTHPEKLLSLSMFEDEAAVARWRTSEAHRVAQQVGRAEVFRDYRLRVASVIRDYGFHGRAEAPQDSRAVHDGG